MFPNSRSSLRRGLLKLILVSLLTLLRENRIVPPFSNVRSSLVAVREQVEARGEERGCRGVGKTLEDAALNA